MSSFKSITSAIRKNIYKWHRITSLVVALPVLLWTVSGFLHPVMNSFKPVVRNSFLPAAVADTALIRVSLQDALQQNNIHRIHNFRIVKLYEIFYYQVQQNGVDTLTYINCNTGNVLLGGDKAYAAHLAQRYLSEPVAQGSEGKGGHHHAQAAAINVVAGESAFPKAKVKSVELITKFTPEYKESNKLLPVYKVQFQREDNIRLYIETVADRLAVAVDDRKAWFTRFFSLTHSWSFLNGLGKLKFVLLGSFSALCFATSLFGFYIYNISNKKKIRQTNFTQKNRRWHRLMGNVFLVTTLLYALSGAWHSFNKLPEKVKTASFKDHSEFTCRELPLSITDVQSRLQQGEQLTNVSVVRMDGRNYWQVAYKKGKEKGKKYFDIQTGAELKDGDNQYGCYLACQFSGNQHHEIKHSQCLTSFNHTYSMMNKRLPVIEVAFDENENYYRVLPKTMFSGVIFCD